MEMEMEIQERFRPCRVYKANKEFGSHSKCSSGQRVLRSRVTYYEGHLGFCVWNGGQWESPDKRRQLELGGNGDRGMELRMHTGWAEYLRSSPRHDEVMSSLVELLTSRVQQTAQSLRGPTVCLCSLFYPRASHWSFSVLPVNEQINNIDEYETL